MPPKLKVLKTHQCDGLACEVCRNPRVVIRPFLSDMSGCSRSNFSTLPPTAALYNKPTLSDTTLKVGDESFYVHRLILSAGSEVFARMLGTEWKECGEPELELNEEPDCAAIFDRFLYYFYTGTITITESVVIPLFTLADKYDVRPLYDECVKVIENGLKVYVMSRSPKPVIDVATRPPGVFVVRPLDSPTTSTSSDSDYSESDDMDTASAAMPSQNTTGSTTVVKSFVMVASETFPLVLVIKILTFCNNSRITSAALYNLEARLKKQIQQERYGVWNDLDRDLLLRMLADGNFYCNEYTLFKAAKSWLEYQPETHRGNAAMVAEVLSCVRYPMMDRKQLYAVENDPLMQSCPAATTLLQEALRYKLFKDVGRSDDLAKWQGPQFEARQVKCSDRTEPINLCINSKNGLHKT
ncbi:hypothetical protein NP493_995g00086 [Ridgeia piscesae]|uniref:BTB domain-containing protein n=1 Tax=Ridgeia piscesae TaxID=27915 RepID=A0AAD9KI66_RIDPI|nr:hypothetical protein NP493_995g00086 [Ridgeia piscesae]